MFARKDKYILKRGNSSRSSSLSSDVNTPSTKSVTYGQRDSRPTTASLSAPPAADSYGFPASTHVCYNVPIHVWEIELLLLQDSDCETVSQQNYDNLTSLLGAKDAFVLLLAGSLVTFVLWNRV